MKRSSLAVPVFLIGIGLLLLLNNIRPDLSIGALLLEQWPLLLVLWGTIRFAEVTMAALSHRSVPVNGIRGGEWVLIVVFTLVASGSTYASRNPIPIRLASPFLPLEPFVYPVSANAKCGSQAKIVLLMDRGDAHIVAGQPGEVTVTGQTTIRSLDKAHADQANLQTGLTIDQSPNGVTIRIKGGPGDGSVESDLQISLPADASLEVHGVRGDFDISGLAGDVKVESRNAGVRASYLGGNLFVELQNSDIIRASKVKGTVELRGKGQEIELDEIGGKVAVRGRFSGDQEYRSLAQEFSLNDEKHEVRLASIPGQLHLSRGDVKGTDLVGPIFVSSSSSDVTLETTSGPIRIEVARGDIDLQPGRIPLNPIVARTSNGDIALSIPDGAGYQLNARTNRGSVQNEIGDPLKTEEGEDSDHGGSIRGSVGEGPALSLTTQRGGLTVRHGAVVTGKPFVAPAQPKEAKKESDVTINIGGKRFHVKGDGHQFRVE